MKNSADKKKSKRKSQKCTSSCAKIFKRGLHMKKTLKSSLWSKLPLTFVMHVQESAQPIIFMEMLQATVS